MNVKVGDTLLLYDGQQVPADCILLASAHKEGTCFVQTAQLDGERNLKPKQALSSVQAKLGSELKDDLTETIKVSSSPPDKNLYSFDGKL
jgi:phospholipid-translocating ATPase